MPKVLLVLLATALYVSPCGAFSVPKLSRFKRITMFAKVQGGGQGFGQGFAPISIKGPSTRVPADSEQCGCSSGKTYGTCCGRFHRGIESVGSPEDVLRSRFTAYKVCQVFPDLSPFLGLTIVSMICLISIGSLITSSLRRINLRWLLPNLPPFSTTLQRRATTSSQKKPKGMNY